MRKPESDDPRISRIPEEELQRFLNTVSGAIELAMAGYVATGAFSLEFGLELARAARDEDEPWGEALAEEYKDALARYSDQFGGRLVDAV